MYVSTPHCFVLVEFVGPLVPSAKITELTPARSERYRPWHLLTDNNAEYWQEHGMTNYWASRDGHTGPAFTYELSLAAHVAGFSVRNTGNAHHNDRGTNAFKLLASLDGKDFREVHSGSLPDARNRFTSTPSVKVDLEQPVLAKFVRFDVVSFYGKGPGLHYFKAHCDLFN